MRASTTIVMLLLALMAALASAFIIFRLPFVPNWPYVWAVSAGGSIVLGGIYAVLARGHLKPPVPITIRGLVRLFPIWLSVFAVFWSVARLTIEKNESLEFSNGVVAEKYVSRNNHAYLSVKVEVAGRGILAVEGISPASWDAVSSGSIVSKRCGASDIVVDRPKR